MRGALAALLSMEDDIEVVAQVSTGDAVVPTALELRPDVAMLDIEMPGMDGLAAAAALRTAIPACRVLIVTTFGRPGYLRQAMEAGATGLRAQGRAGQPARGRHPPGGGRAGGWSIRRSRSTPCRKVRTRCRSASARYSRAATEPGDRRRHRARP